TNPPGADLNVAKQRPEGGAGRTPAINCQASNKAESPQGFLLWEKWKIPVVTRFSFHRTV
ncbi:hypothetical protein ACVCGZ_22735, partial [Serratia nematodiphila]